MSGCRMMENKELADMLEELAKTNQEPWVIEKEKHNYPDGTTHFTHVGFIGHDCANEPMDIRIASYLTPDTAELITLLKNNVRQIIEALRK